MNNITPKLYTPAVSHSLQDAIDSFEVPNYQMSKEKAIKVNYRPSFSYFNIGNHYNYAPAHNPNSKDKDNSNRVLLGIAFTAISLLAAFFVGRAVGNIEKANVKLANLKELREFHRDTEQELQGKQVYNKETLITHMQNLDKAIKMGKEVAHADHKSAVRDLVIRVGFIAFAALGLAGTVANAPAAIVIGAAGVGTLFAIQLIKWGYEGATSGMATRKINHAVTLLRSVKEAVDMSMNSSYRPTYMQHSAQPAHYNFTQPQQQGPGSYGVQPSLFDYVMPAHAFPSAPPVDL